MARTCKGIASGKIAGGVLIAATICAIASAQDAPAPASPSPFTQECQTGSDAVVDETPLPNVAAALANRKTVRILTIGASASAGRRATRGGYTALIEQLTERAVKGLDVVMINRGISGELAANAAIRIRIEVALRKPDLVLWQVGANDALAYVPVFHFKAAVVDAVRWLRGHKIDVILVGLQYVDRMARNAHYNDIRKALREIAADERVMMVRRGEAIEMINRASSEGGGLLPDEFEQTETGYTCLAQYVARAITLGVFAKGMRSEGAPPPPPPPPSEGVRP